MVLDLPTNNMFQHNGAPFYYSRTVQELLKEQMPDESIEQKVLWVRQLGFRERKRFQESMH